MLDIERCGRERLRKCFGRESRTAIHRGPAYVGFPVINFRPQEEGDLLNNRSGMCTGHIIDPSVVKHALICLLNGDVPPISLQSAFYRRAFDGTTAIPNEDDSGGMEDAFPSKLRMGKARTT